MIRIIDENSEVHGIGGKASNLYRLRQLDIAVPKFIVIPESVLLEQLTSTDNYDKFKTEIEQVCVPDGLEDELIKYFGPDYRRKSYAIRSSATDEDGMKHSFAGQFETYLNVEADRINESIIKIWKSVASERVVKYRLEHGLPPTLGIAVIIQEMIEPDVAGVGFGLDPVSGDRETKIISAVYGLGEGLVSGDLNADTFKITKDGVTERLVEKKYKLVQSENGEGTVKVLVNEDMREIAALAKTELDEISDLLDKLFNELGSPQDIEFAFKDGKLFLLQTRPITAIGKTPKGEYTLWDNSNIIESYPGVTTPLTFTFIIKMYERVYSQFARLLGVKENEILRHKEVFANTLGLIRGRVYYSLLSWYKMLAMLPGYSINAQYMETMMGVKERFDLKEDYQMSKGLARLRIVEMIFRMIWVHARLGRERKKFIAHLNTFMNKYDQLDFSNMSAAEIVNHYMRFETTLLLKWKAPLINDFFAMIWFGVLKKKTNDLLPNEPNVHNDLLCGSQDIISVEPIHRSIDIAREICNDSDAHELFVSHDQKEIWDQMNQGKSPKIKELIDQYISKFGDRCVGELKLETISYSQDPTLFINVIKSYVTQNITSYRSDTNIEETLRKNAELKIAAALEGKLLKRWWFNYILRKARDLVSNRENLRYERTRGFGMVRKMFIALGERLHADHVIDNPRDIFYLELDEVLKLDSEDLRLTLKHRIQERQIEFENYRSQKSPEERFFTYGNDFSDEYIYSKEKLEPIEGDLEGIGCCPGRVQAKVRVVSNPSEIDSLNGDILVTSSTDPGWVTLFPTASAIIVERGSLLSHSAIVSRELGIPCIVGVTGLLRTVKTGDEVVMDGSAGTIQILK